jgi:two-component system, cell cycle sensor histidine kinase and response regulator CckA
MPLERNNKLVMVSLKHCKNNNPIYLKIILLILLVGLFAPNAWAAPSKHVLVLHSYHKGLTWTDAITKGIEATFGAASVPIEIEYAFMDTKHIFNQAYLDQLVDLYRVKYHHRSFDAIISSDDHAFNFLLRNHAALFGETPIIFCGVNYFNDRMLLEEPNITGVLESFDMLSTINTALDLQPHANRLIAIGDQTVSGKANRKKMEEIVPRLKRPVEITILDNHTMAEVQAYVGGLSAQDIVVWLVFTVDRNGDFFSFEESTRLISTHSLAPMYAFWDFNLGYGIVGGMLTSGEMQGQRAAELALRIIQGESASTVPVIKESPNQYMFDYLQMERFGLKLSQLPAESLVINRPETFYSQNRRLVWTILSIFCAMATIILWLLTAIASRKKAERALFSSKDRYQNVFNSTAVALLEVDFAAVRKDIDKWVSEGVTDYRSYLELHPEALRNIAGQMSVKDVNPAAMALFKTVDKQTLINALPQKFLSDQTRALKEIVIAFAEKRDHVVWEDEFKNLDSAPLHAIISLNFQYDQNNYHNMVISVFDITDRKISEEAQRRSEDRFRTIFNQAASGMALMDLEGRYLRVNSALGHMLGYTERELFDRTWRDIIHKNDRSSSMAHIDKVLGGAVTQPVEKRYIHKAGHLVYVLFNLSAIFDEERQPLYLIAQFQDITQIKAAQAALKEREERYRQFFEGDLSGVYMSTPDGELIMCNEVFAKILGFSTSEAVIGTPISNYYKYPDQRTQLISQIIENKRIDQFELELVRKDGAILQCLINAVGRFNEQGELSEIQGYLMDVTRMKSLEAQLLHAQKMESIGTMAGGVAHDFNNLLMGIMGNTSLMLMAQDRAQPDYQRLKNIEQLVQSGSDLTRQLLGFAKGGKYEVRTTDLNKLILRSIEMFARTQKETQVCTELSDNLMLVEADRGQIDQVLYNLYLNAWQAMENGGRINIRTRNQSLDTLAAAPYGLVPGDYVEVSVQDDGAGMEMETQQRIFDPFFTTKERERGTGLGLASAYGIIQNHAGSITVKSKPGEGSCFTIFLPASNNKPMEFAPEALVRVIPGTETILLVDDELSVLDVVGGMLNYLGYTVRTAADGQTAIETLQKDQENIDLIILDMVMPGMGGGEAFERFKRINPNVKVLLCSGYAANGQAAGIIKCGCLGFIQKPFTINKLSQKLNQVFQRK